MRVELPWPPSILSPNSRAHWAKRIEPKNTSKMAGYMLTYQARRECGYTPPEEGLIKVRFTFHPPDRRSRDDDNNISRTKWLRDGIANGLGVDDKRFRCEYVMADPIKGGKVIFEIVEASDEIHGVKGEAR